MNNAVINAERTAKYTGRMLFGTGALCFLIGFVFSLKAGGFPTSLPYMIGGLVLMILSLYLKQLLLILAEVIKNE